MRKYGLLRGDSSDSFENVNVFELDRHYWHSLYWKGEFGAVGGVESK